MVVSPVCRWRRGPFDSGRFFTAGEETKHVQGDAYPTLTSSQGKGWTQLNGKNRLQNLPVLLLLLEISTPQPGKDLMIIVKGAVRGRRRISPAGIHHTWYDSPMSAGAFSGSKVSSMFDKSSACSSSFLRISSIRLRVVGSSSPNHRRRKQRGKHLAGIWQLRRLLALHPIPDGVNLNLRHGR